MDSPTQRDVDPIVWAVIYIRWLIGVARSHPLFGIPYVGQTVRSCKSSLKVAKARWRDEDSVGRRSRKVVGLLSAIKDHGATAFRNIRVEWRKGRRSEMLAWANDRERWWIHRLGGPLQDPLVRLKQTLNLTDGGAGSAFAGHDASRSAKWARFASELSMFVSVHKTAAVHTGYVAASGYRLSQTLTTVRNGVYLDGHPHEDTRRRWLESLPGWVWNGNTAKEATIRRHTAAARSWSCLDEMEKEQRLKPLQTSAARSKRVLSMKEYIASLSAEERKKRFDHLQRSSDDRSAITTSTWSKRSVEERQRIGSKMAKTKQLKPAEEQAATNAKRRNTIADKQNACLSMLNEKERRSKELKIAREKRKSQHKAAVLANLRKIPGWEHAKQADVPRARRERVIV